MQAAAAGKSTLGIPKSVGKEYSHADALRRGNYTDENGMHHSHWKSSGSTVGGAIGTMGGGAG